MMNLSFQFPVAGFRNSGLRLVAGLLLAASLVPAAQAADASKKPEKPQTKVTQTLSQATYKQMEIAQKAFDAKDYKGAEAALDVLKAKQEKLNDYERATLWNLYAGVFRAQEDNKRAIGAYVTVLKQPNLPDGLHNDALFALAQTYFLIDDYAAAIRVLDKWFASVQDVQPDAWILYAQAWYQQQKYEQAKAPILKALGIAKSRNLPLKENWLGLLRAVYFELKDYGSAAKVMEILVTTYPKDSYFLQLAGIYGLLGEQKKQAEVMHLAYLGGYVHNPGDLLNVARLYLAEEAPARAVDLLKAKFRDKTLDVNAENLQLLAQSLALAKETEQSIPVLTKLAGMTGESKHYNYLGQAYTQLNNWPKAADAFQAALKGKDVANAANLQMQLGTALYNAGKLNDAKQAFIAASSADHQKDAALNWVKFIDTEIQRNNALRARG